MTVYCGIQTYLGDPSELNPSVKKLFGPCGILLSFTALAKAWIIVDNQTIHNTRYVVRNQNVHILSKSAYISLGLIQCITKYGHNIDSNED